MKLGSDASVPSGSGPKSGESVFPALATTQYWEDVFVEPDPWDYANSGYEKWKFELTLSLLPKRRIRRSLEIGCAEGHLTELLAANVGSLLSIDISPTALERARSRCGHLSNVDFEVLNLAKDELPDGFDLIFCSEVLFYLPRLRLEAVAPGIVRSLNSNGHLLLAHGNIIADDNSKTGFDWGHDFGARTIGEIFAAQDELALVRELRSPLFTIQLFRRVGKGKKAPASEIEDIVLPPDLELSPTLEKTILWGGAVMTRAEAAAKEAATSVPILMYHSVADDGPAELAPYRVSPAAFREQLLYLRRNGFHAITLGDWAEHITQRRPVWGRPVIITFDDAYRDFIHNALPALERADFSATVFVVTEKVGGLADWDKLSKPLQLMDWDELKAIAAKGITVGSHSASHKDLSSLPLDQVRSEGERSRAMLRDRLGLDVDIIAFPWGKSSAAARAALAACGYRIGVRSWGGTSPVDDDLLNLARIEIEADDDIAAFAKKLTVKGEKAAPDIAGISHTAVPILSMPIQPYVPLSLAARLDALIGEFVKLQSELLNKTDATPTLQKRLVSLFTLPVTGKLVRPVTSGQEVITDIQVNFEDGAEVAIWVEPKADHSLSPDVYLNTFGVSFSGQSRWLTLEINLDWRDLSLSSRFQVSLYGQTDRPLLCETALRLPRKSGTSLEITFAQFALSDGERNAVAQGELALPDFIDLDTSQRPQLLLFLDTTQNLSLVMHYFNVYFA